MRHQERPGKKSLFASIGVHVVAVAAAWLAQVSVPEPLNFETYQITLVSPPPAQEAPEPTPAPVEEIVVETPDPPPVEEPPPVIEEERIQEERPTPTPTPTPPRPEPEEEVGDPEPAEEIGGEDLNVHMEGLQRDFPVYYGNIVTQIRRCLDYRGGGNRNTVIFFYIRRDGWIDGRSIRFMEQSGNVNFDFAAMGAVECAGSGRFGPLPEEMGRDRLPIVFEFKPGGTF